MSSVPHPAHTIRIVPVGDNPQRLWGLSMDERTRRIAGAAGFAFGRDLPATGAAVLVNTAHVFDPIWLRHFAARPGEGLTLGGVPVIAHCRDAGEAAAVAEAMRAGGEVPAALSLKAFEDGAQAVNTELRKREQPFAMRLTSETVRTAERASYFGAYKGVTDVLTKYLWPEWALVLTRIAARIGMSPNMVTAIGALLCVLATFAFARGEYWAGMAMGLVFMVLDTVDGKLARCTITSSKWGNVFDHGIDLVHPPFWWVAWAIGLAAYGLPIERPLLDIVLAVIIVGYVVQRVIEGIFIRSYGMHIHVWGKIDSDFRLVTARRNPNMVILFGFMLFQRPDLGLIAVAGWTLLSLLFHAVRLLQAMAAPKPIRSWMEG